MIISMAALAALMWLLSSDATAQVINPVKVGEGERISAVDEGSFGFASGKLIFAIQAEGSYQPVWVSDGSPAGTFALHPEAIVRDANFQILGSHTLFMAYPGVEDEPFLWVTDGTPEGTRQLADFPLWFGSHLNRSGPLIVGSNSDGRGIVVSDGSNTQQIETEESYDSSSVCAFGLDDFVGYARSNELVRYQPSTRTVIDVAELGIVSLHQLYGVEMDGEACYFSVLTPPLNTRRVIRITRDGTIDEVALPGEADVFIDLIESLGEVFAFRRTTDSNAPGGLFRLRANGEPEAVFEGRQTTETDSASLGHVVVSPNYIYASYAGDILAFTIASPSYTAILNRRTQAITTSQGNFASPGVGHVGGMDVLPDLGGIRLYSDDAPGVQFFDAYLAIHFILSNNRDPESNSVFFLAQDVFGRVPTNLYVLADAPVISRRIDGLWIASEVPNQGMMLRVGSRDDDSQYLFAGIFSQRNDARYWLAGNGDFSIGQSSISVDLVESEGGEFFTPTGASDNQPESAGTLTIEPSGCDTLTATFDLVAEETERVVDFVRLSVEGEMTLCQ